MRKPSWQELYRVAVLETDAAKIEERMKQRNWQYTNGRRCCPRKDKLLTMLRGVFPFCGREAARPRIQPLSLTRGFCADPDGAFFAALPLNNRLKATRVYDAVCEVKRKSRIILSYLPTSLKNGGN